MRRRACYHRACRWRTCFWSSSARSCWSPRPTTASSTASRSARFRRPSPSRSWRRSPSVEGCGPPTGGSSGGSGRWPSRGLVGVAVTALGSEARHPRLRQPRRLPGLLSLASRGPPGRTLRALLRKPLLSIRRDPAGPVDRLRADGLEPRLRELPALPLLALGAGQRATRPAPAGGSLGRCPRANAVCRGRDRLRRPGDDEPAAPPRSSSCRRTTASRPRRPSRSRPVATQ